MVIYLQLLITQLLLFLSYTFGKFTRQHNGNLNVSRCLNVCKYFIVHNGSYFLNNLPTHLKNISNIETYRENVFERYFCKKKTLYYISFYIMF